MDGVSLGPLEEVRMLHEESERLIDAGVDDLLQAMASDHSNGASTEVRTFRENAVLAHRMARRATAIHSTERGLAGISSSLKGSSAETLLSPNMDDVATGDALKTFYSRVEAVHRDHQKHPQSNVWFSDRGLDGEEFPLGTPPRIRSLEEVEYDIFPQIYQQESGSHPPADPSLPELGVGLDSVLPAFRGEEVFGRQLDLHADFLLFSNTHYARSLFQRTVAGQFPGSDVFVDEGGQFDPPRPEYAWYLRHLAHFDDEIGLKVQADYVAYLTRFLRTLQDYLDRCLPLEDTASWFDALEERAQRLISSKEFTTWANYRAKNQPSSGTKDIPTVDPLYCTTCKRTYAKQTVFDSHLRGKKHQTLLAAQEVSNSDSSDSSKPQRNVVVRQVRVQVLELSVALTVDEWLGRALVETLSSVEVKQARAGLVDSDLTQGGDALLPGVISLRQDGKTSNQDLDATSYSGSGYRKASKKDYPIGWDGNPIPFWLYKLYGLGVRYPCEICGGEEYRGRKEYEGHFQEWRHALGMKALGIPNTKAFHDIVRVADARALWAHLQERGPASSSFSGVNPPTVSGGEAAVPETFVGNMAQNARDDSETEDEEGNVYSRRDYEDLRRQGLL